MKIHFWRTTSKAEVDFGIDSGSAFLPIEIKYSELKNPIIEKSLRSFIEKYQPVEALVINKNLEDNVIIGKTKVKFSPFTELKIVDF